MYIGQVSVCFRIVYDYLDAFEMFLGFLLFFYQQGSLNTSQIL